MEDSSCRVGTRMRQMYCGLVKATEEDAKSNKSAFFKFFTTHNTMILFQNVLLGFCRGIMNAFQELFTPSLPVLLLTTGVRIAQRILRAPSQ